jgi:hypothetical protein
MFENAIANQAAPVPFDAVLNCKVLCDAVPA